MIDSRFLAQLELLLRVLPFIANEKIFALKGGTALNLFVWDLPRLSVDIDLTYLPLKSRDKSFQEIGEAVGRIKLRIESAFPKAKVDPISVAGAPASFTVQLNEVQIKVEINLILRGTVFPTVSYELCARAQKEFGAYVELNGLSKADLYGGKICAALDRQHPRDFFDVMILLKNDGITDEIRKAFLVYLASHSRPMNELLDPTWKDITEVFRKEFVGMTRDPITLADLLAARDDMFIKLKTDLTTTEKRFLISVKEGNPDWHILGIPGLEQLPGLQWKLVNVRKMAPAKQQAALDKLKAALN